MTNRRRLAPLTLLVVATLTLAACGGDDETTTATSSTSTTTSAATGATGAEGAASLDSITSALEDAGYTIEELSLDDLPADTEHVPDAAAAASGNEIPEGAFVNVEQYATDDDAASALKNYETTDVPAVGVETIVFFGTPPAEQSDVEAVANAAGS